jgi:RNA polymerase sigma-70 factor, ECF subfamily
LFKNKPEFWTCSEECSKPINGLHLDIGCPHFCGVGNKSTKISGGFKMQDQLIIRLKEQDQSVVGDLYDAYGGALYGVVLKVVHSHDLAQQVLQDTFVKAWRKSGAYDAAKGRLFTWLLNIARNTAIDATRTAHYQHQSRTDSLDNLVHKPGGEALNPDHLGLQDLVDNLDEKYRSLIELVYFRGFTQEEAAEETGIPLGTVKTRLRTAIAELRQSFA